MYLGLVVGHSSLRGEIGLVANQQLVHVLGGVSEQKISKTTKLARATKQRTGSIKSGRRLAGVTSHPPINFVEPLLHIVEALQISGVVDNNNSVRTAIVTRGNSSETLLTSSVPLSELKTEKGCEREGDWQN